MPKRMADLLCKGIKIKGEFYFFPWNIMSEAEFPVIGLDAW